MRLALLFSALSCLASVAIAAWAWPDLPDPMPVHWNASGQADDHASRSVALGIAPALGLVLPLLVGGLMRLDPRRAALEDAHRTVTLVLVALALFPVALQGTIVHAALSADQAMDPRALLAAVGLLVAVLGFGMRDLRSNYVYGIRTPWALEDEEVWHRTHRLGAWTLGGGGVVAAALPWVLPASWAVGVAVAAITLGALVPAAASWWFWRERQG